MFDVRSSSFKTTPWDINATCEGFQNKLALMGISGRGNAGYYLILILGGIPFSKNAGYDTADSSESFYVVSSMLNKSSKTAPSLLLYANNFPS